MHKSVIVLFSGGIDSTYLIWKNLQEGNIVLPMYIDIDNNKEKAKIEKSQITKIWNILNDEYIDNLLPINYSIKIGIDKVLNDNLRFHQVPIWILSSLFFQSEEFDEIQIGYVSEDTTLGYLEDIEKIYKSYESISPGLIPVTFPIKKSLKEDIVNELPEDLLELVYSCEHPKNSKFDNNGFMDSYEPCGICPQCEVIINSDFYNLGLSKPYLLVKKKLWEEDLKKINEDLESF